MINAKEELLRDLSPDYAVSDIIAYNVELEDREESEECKGTDPQKLLEYLDKEYDNGYGCQLLFGTILLKDGVWLTRAEYDGSEWWEFNIPPKVEDLIK